MTKQELENLANVDIRKVDKSTLVDIDTISVNMSLSPEERTRDYIENIKNPYCVIVDDTVVKLKFSDTENTIEEILNRYYKMM